MAVDVSETVLAVVDKKVEDCRMRNVETVHDGFLSYDHSGDPTSFAFSKDALHHLPDFWKVEAIKTVGNTLEAGGIFRLRDFVFSFDPKDSRNEIESWLEEKKRSTTFTDEELYVHFREKYSTYGFGTRNAPRAGRLRDPRIDVRRRLLRSAHLSVAGLF